MAPTITTTKRKARESESEQGLDLARNDDLNLALTRTLDEDDEEVDDGNEEEEEEEEEDESRPELELDDEEEEELRTLLSNGVDGVFSEDDDEDEDESEFSDLLSGEEESSDEESKPNYTLTLDANGGERYLYDEIAPVYDSDDSATLETNTIGNIPLSFYDSYPHIGYDINGKKISRPARGEALDTLLDSIDVPKGWTGLTDPNTGTPLQLKPEELKLLAQIQRGELRAVNGDGAYDPYPDLVEYFSNTVETMPLSSAPEPKRRFIPSKHEQKRILKIARAIKLGHIKPWRAEKEEESDDEVKRYDIWKDEAPRKDHVMHVPAPKLPPPGYDESYHPPAEYLPDETERKKFDEADEEDREREFLPQDHDALRKVKGYEKFIKERFERCLDLYLAPRVRRKKLNIDPESLLPKLPAPEDLRPFPSACATVFRGHQGRVRSVSVDPAGCWLASGGDDGTVKVWEIKTGRMAWSVLLSDERVTRDRNVEAVHMVRWRPAEVDGPRILAAACGDDIYLMVPQRLDPDSEAVDSKARSILDAGFGYAAQSNGDEGDKRPTAKWTRPGAHLEESNVLLKISLSHTVKVIAWHRRGEYFCSVAPSGSSNAVAIHSLSKHLTQLPFRKLKGYPQAAIFHPSKPHFLVATQRLVRIYDLQKQTLLRVLQPGARWISSLDMHPQGDNVLVSSYDKRLLWHDLDLSTRPYKTLRYHTKAIRATKFHSRYPLFADASDDGTVQVFHGKVVGDLLENATIVPLKVLRGHAVKSQLGVLDLEWHPREPWLVSAGADGTCRLWC